MSTYRQQANDRFWRSAAYHDAQIQGTLTTLSGCPAGPLFGSPEARARNATSGVKADFPNPDLGSKAVSRCDDPRRDLPTLYRPTLSPPPTLPSRPSSAARIPPVCLAPLPAVTECVVGV